MTSNPIKLTKYALTFDDFVRKQGVFNDSRKDAAFEDIHYLF